MVVLALWENTALVQLIQFLVLGFFVLLMVAAGSARVHLPKSKWEPLWDILLVVVLLIYAVGLKIIFST